MTWFNTSYLNKKKITIDHTKVSGGSDLSSFPVLISRTDTDLKVVGSGGSVQNSSGFDIIFTNSNQDTKLDHEIEKYVSTTGEIEMWVRIPTLSASSDTVIYMYFNNSSISTSQENITGVWDSNYVGVWHLKESTGSNPADSTSNALTATQNNSPTQGAGQIDGSLSFNGSTQYLDLGTSSTLRPSSLPVTMSAWVKPSSLTAIDAIFTNNKTGNTTHSGVWMQVNTTGKIEIDYGDNGGSASSNRRTKVGTTVLSTGTWYYIVGVLRGATDMTIYVNGTDDGGTLSGTGGSLTYNTSLHANIARIGDDPSGFFFMNGSLDDVRFSKVERVAGWVTTEYNNQNSPSTFYSVSAITSLATKKFTARFGQLTGVQKKFSARFPQLAGVSKKFSARFSQLTGTSKKFTSRFSQLTGVQKKFASRFFQSTLVSKKFTSRFSQLAGTSQKFTSRFSQSALAQKVFRSRFGQLTGTFQKFKGRFFQAQYVSKKFSSRFSQLAGTSRVFSARFWHVSTNAAQQVFSARFRQMTGASKKFSARLYQVVLGQKAFKNRFSQSALVRKIWGSRFFQMTGVRKVYQARFGQLMGVPKAWKARFYQIVLGQKSFKSRLYQTDKAPKIYKVRLFQIDTGKRLFKSRLFQYDRAAKTYKVRVKHTELRSKIFPTRLSQYSKSQRVWIARFGQVSVGFTSKLWSARLGHVAHHSKIYATRFGHIAREPANITLYVRSGDISTHVRSGEAVTYTRSGDIAEHTRSGDITTYTRSGDIAVYEE